MKDTSYQTVFLTVSPKCLRLDLSVIEVDTAKCASSHRVKTQH